VADARGAVVVRDRRHTAIRDPQAATIATGWADRGMPMVPEWDAAGAIRLAYLSNTIVYRCVQTIANALSRVPFRAGADPDRPKDYDRRGTTGLARLLSPPPYGPNTETSARQLWAWTVAQYLVTGRFGWENELDQQDRPVALWPLPSTQLNAIPTASGAHYFERFLYGPKIKEKRLSREQVTYGWRPSPHDWREPESVLQAARLDISVAIMQDRYDYAFLRNGSRPDFLLIHEVIDDDDERQAFRDQFAAEHRGPENAGKPAFAEAEGGGESGSLVDVKQLGLTQRDAQALERSKHKLNMICLAFGTPMSKLGDSSGRTFSNAGQENRNWWEDTVLPLGDELGDIINMKLAPRLGSNVGWFDWSAVPALRPEPRAQMVGVPALVSGRVATINEGRAMVDLPPIGPEGDLLADEQPAPDLQAAAAAFQALVTAGVTPESAAAATGFDGLTMRPAEPTPAPAVPPQPKATDRGRQTEQRADQPTPDEQAAAALARRDARWKLVNDRAEAMERTWERQFRRLFDRQEKATLSRLKTKRGRQLLRDALTAAQTRAPDDPAPQVDPDDIFDPTFWTDDTAETSRALYEPLTTMAGQEIAERFGVSFDLDAPWVQEFIDARSNQLAGQVTDTTYRAIQQALAEGVAAGESVDDLATRVQDVFTNSRTRATTIARTEVISAYNGAGQLTAAQLPADVVAAQEWIATRDARTREAHADADGQTVRIGEPFTIDGEQLAYPGDPAGSGSNTVQCRCTLGFLTPDELPEDMRTREVDVRVARAVLALADAVDPDTIRGRLLAVA
jgi:HK97 family phage portal protein